MNIALEWLRHASWLAVLSVVVAGGTGCATSGRYVLLKEYGPSVPANPESPLKGKIICVNRFQCAPSLTSDSPKTEPEEPPRFVFMQFTEAQRKAWDQEFRALKKRGNKAEWREIGNVRNGLGMVMSHVHALNDPGMWLAETLKMDLQQQGAKVVGPSECNSAELCVSGTIQFCRVDVYMKIWGDLVVDLDLKPRNGSNSRTRLHTKGGTTAWVGSTAEFYKPLRESQQKFSRLASREIIKALNQLAAAGN